MCGEGCFVRRCKPESVLDRIGRFNYGHHPVNVFPAAFFYGLPHQGFLLRTAHLHGPYQGQCGFAFGQIVSDVFADLLTGGAVIQGVVDDLEGGAEVQAIFLEGLFLGLGDACENAPELGAGFEALRWFPVPEEL